MSVRGKGDMASSNGAYACLSIGVVVERREIDNRWVDFDWRPIAIIPGAPPKDVEEDWTVLREGEGWTQYHAATLSLELFQGETQGYKVNLANHLPHIYIVLSPGEEEDEPEIVPHLVTVCPYEAESYTEDSEQIVEGVPMPEVVAAWVKDFCDTYHVEQEFKKRKRKAYDPRKGDFFQGPAADRPRRKFDG